MSWSRSFAMQPFCIEAFFADRFVRPDTPAAITAIPQSRLTTLATFLDSYFCTHRVLLFLGISRRTNMAVNPVLKRRQLYSRGWVDQSTAWITYY